MKSKIEIIGILVMVFILFVLIPLSFSIMKIFAQDITVYNFSSITNPSTTHIAWNGTDTGLPPSNLILLTENELKDVNYDKLDNSDNTRTFHFSGTASRYASQKFRFQISESSINKINVSWEGYGCFGGPSPGSCPGGYGVRLYIWNFTTSTWGIVGTHSSSGDNNITKAFTSTGDFINGS